MVLISGLFRLFKKKQPVCGELILHLKKITGLTTKRADLYEEAFRHKSVTKKGESSNERLEFLGDTVLDLVVAGYLFERFPDRDEGFLTKLKAKIVSRDSLNNLSAQLDLKPFIRYHQSRSNYKSLEGNVLEALVGAIYIDKGYKYTKRLVIDKIIAVLIDLDELVNSDTDFKSKLYIWGQRERKEIAFELLEEKNLGTRMKYRMALLVDGKTIATAEGSSKKEAEKLASKKASKILFPTHKLSV